MGGRRRQEEAGGDRKPCPEDGTYVASGEGWGRLCGKAKRNKGREVRGR
jgi:hypothetical protein